MSRLDVVNPFDIQAVSADLERQRVAQEQADIERMLRTRQQTAVQDQQNVWHSILESRLMSAESRAHGADIVRQFIVDVMSSPNGPGKAADFNDPNLTVNGKVIRTFDSVDAKNAYINEMSQDGAWIDDTAMRVFAEALDIHVRVHVVDHALSSTESLVSYNLDDSDEEKQIIHVVNSGAHLQDGNLSPGVHWEAATVERPEDAAKEKRAKVTAVSNSGVGSSGKSGNCGPTALYDAVMMTVRKQAAPEYAAESGSSTAEYLEADHNLIVQVTQQARGLVNQALETRDVSFDAVLRIAERMAAVKHGTNDVYLDGHVKTAKASKKGDVDLLALVDKLAVRAGVEGSNSTLFKLLQDGLKQLPMKGEKAALSTATVGVFATAGGDKRRRSEAADAATADFQQQQSKGRRTQP
jgi:hypothetical protein